MSRSFLPVASFWSPALLDDMRKEMGRVVGDLWDGNGSDGKTFAPRLNLAESDKAYEITIDLPGIDPQDVSLEFKDGQLWVSGERKFEEEEKGKSFHRIERGFGQFRRVISLGTDVDADNVDASYKNGVLSVTVPKAAAVQPRKIAVRS